MHYTNQYVLHLEISVLFLSVCTQNRMAGHVSYSNFLCQLRSLDIPLHLAGKIKEIVRQNQGALIQEPVTDGAMGVTPGTVTDGAMGVTPGTVTDGAMGVTPGTVTDGAMGVTPGTVTDGDMGVTRDTVLDGAKGVTPGTVTDGAMGVTPDSVTDGAMGVTPGTVTDGAMGVTPDTVTDGAMGVTPDTVTDRAMGVTPDTVTDGAMGVTPGTVTVVTPDTVIEDESLDLSFDITDDVLRDACGPGDVLRDAGEAGDVLRDAGGPDDVLRDAFGPGDVLRDAGEAGDVLRDAGGPDDVLRDACGAGNVLRDAGEAGDVLRDAGGPDDVLRDASGAGNVLRDAGGPGDVLRDAGEAGDVLRDAGGPDDVLRDAGEAGDVLRDAGEAGDVLRDAGGPDDVLRDAGGAGDVLRDACGAGNVLRDAGGPGDVLRDAGEAGDVLRDAGGPDDVLRDACGAGNVLRDAGEAGDVLRDAGGPDDVLRDACGAGNVLRDAGGPGDVLRDAGEAGDVLRDAGGPDDVLRDAGEAGDVLRDAGEAGDVLRDAGGPDDVLRDAGGAGDVLRDAGEAGDVLRDAGEAGDVLRDAGEAGDVLRDAGGPDDVLRDACGAGDVFSDGSLDASLDQSADMLCTSLDLSDDQSDDVLCTSVSLDQVSFLTRSATVIASVQLILDKAKEKCDVSDVEYNLVARYFLALLQLQMYQRPATILALTLFDYLHAVTISQYKVMWTRERQTSVAFTASEWQLLCDFVTFLRPAHQCDGTHPAKAPLFMLRNGNSDVRPARQLRTLLAQYELDTNISYNVARTCLLGLLPGDFAKVDPRCLFTTDLLRTPPVSNLLTTSVDEHIHLLRTSPDQIVMPAGLGQSYGVILEDVKLNQSQILDEMRHKFMFTFRQHTTVSKASITKWLQEQTYAPFIDIPKQTRNLLEGVRFERKKRELDQYIGCLNKKPSTDDAEQAIKDNRWSIVCRTADVFLKKFDECAAARTSRSKTRTDVKAAEKLSKLTLNAHIRNQDWPGLMVVRFPGRDQGVIATCSFPPNHYLCNYEGSTYCGKSSRSYLRRKIIEAEVQEDMSIPVTEYCISYEHQNQHITIDSADTTMYGQTLGRLINHTRTHTNIKPEPYIIDGKATLVFKTLRQINIKEELLYDYGDGDLAWWNSCPCAVCKPDLQDYTCVPEFVQGPPTYQAANNVPELVEDPSTYQDGNNVTELVEDPLTYQDGNNVTELVEGPLTYQDGNNVTELVEGPPTYQDGNNVTELVEGPPTYQDGNNVPALVQGPSTYENGNVPALVQGRVESPSTSGSGNQTVLVQSTPSCSRSHKRRRFDY